MYDKDNDRLMPRLSIGGAKQRLDVDQGYGLVCEQEERHAGYLERGGCDEPRRFCVR